jgi:hypothetical protein
MEVPRHPLAIGGKGQWSFQLPTTELVALVAMRFAGRFMNCGKSSMASPSHARE